MVHVPERFAHALRRPVVSPGGADIVLDPRVTLNYTSVLNVVFLLIAAALVWRFLKTGGPMMLKMMNKSEHHHSHI